jgi:RHS repeat-associated protein
LNADGVWEQQTRTEFLFDRQSPRGWPSVVWQRKFDGASGQLLKLTEFTLGAEQLAQTTVTYSPSSRSTIYFGHDGRGNTRALYEANGSAVMANSMVQQFDYNASGELLNLLPNQAATQHLFKSEYTDSVTGHQSLGPRWYDPQQNRFTQSDPSRPYSSLLDVNHMLFAAGDPVNNSDPSGLFTVTGSLGAISIGGQLRSQNIDWNLNALDAAWAAEAAAAAGDNPWSAFMETFYQSAKDSLISSAPVLGSLYDAYGLFQLLTDLAVPIYDLATNAFLNLMGDEGSSNSTSATMARMGGGGPATITRRGKAFLSILGGNDQILARVRKYITYDSFLLLLPDKLRGKSARTAVPVILGANQSNGVNKQHQVQALTQLFHLTEEHPDYEVFALNTRLSTLLRDAQGKPLPEIKVPLSSRYGAKHLSGYQPDAVAIHGRNIDIVEIASPSQMTRGGDADDAYQNYIQNVYDKLEAAGFNSRFRILDSNGKSLWDSKDTRI